MPVTHAAPGLALFPAKDASISLHFLHMHSQSSVLLVQQFEVWQHACLLLWKPYGIFKLILCSVLNISTRTGLLQKYGLYAGCERSLHAVATAQALQEAGVSLEDIASVEVTGGSSRSPAIIGILKDFFKKDPSRTLNATEVISRGCALNCAMLSPIFRCDAPSVSLHFQVAQLPSPEVCSAA